MTLTQKILMKDEYEGLARYTTTTPKAVGVIWCNEEIEVTKSEEVLVLTTQKMDSEEEDKAIISMLQKCIELHPEHLLIVPEYNISEVNAAMFILENDYELVCANMIAHTSMELPEQIWSADVHMSEYCPEKSIFFLPTCGFLGVRPLKTNKEIGLGIINSKYVVELQITKSFPQNEKL